MKAKRQQSEDFAPPASSGGSRIQFILRQTFFVLLCILLIFYSPPIEFQKTYKDLIVLVFAASVVHLRYRICFSKRKAP